MDQPRDRQMNGQDEGAGRAGSERRNGPSSGQWRTRQQPQRLPSTPLPTVQAAPYGDFGLSPGMRVPAGAGPNVAGMESAICSRCAGFRAGG